MLGRKPQRDKKLPDAVPATTSTGEGNKAAARKRKWQEEHSDDSDSEGKITKADLEAWRRTVAEEEKQEQFERDKQERAAKEAERRRRAAAEAEQRLKDEEEAKAHRDAEEARKFAEEAEAERRRQEAATSFIGAGPLPLDVPSVLPAGVRPGKEHLYKTMYCKRWEQGNCQFGAACHFAHGERELRGRPPKGSAPGTMSVALPESANKPAPGRVTGVIVLPPGQQVCACLQGLPPPPQPVVPAGPLVPGLVSPPTAAAQAAVALNLLNSLLANAKAKAAAAMAAGAAAAAGTGILLRPSSDPLGPLSPSPG